MLDEPSLSAGKFLSLGDGQRMRYALFEPEQARGTIVIAPGRREFIEKKYAELGPAFLRRGFRLIIFEWRGQGLSDRLLTGARRQRDHIPDFAVHLNDLSVLYEKVIRPFRTGPLLFCGHSMGGHLLVRWLIECRSAGVAGLMLTAPMLALTSLPVQAAARAISWTSVRLGHDADYAVAQHDYNDSDRAFAKNPLSHDPERFAIIERYFTAHPDMTVGGVTWGWLDAALKSMHKTHQRHYLERLKLPVLCVTGGLDHVTPALELKRYLARMPSARSFIIPGALHDIMNEIDAYRLEAWRVIDAFLEPVTNA